MERTGIEPVTFGLQNRIKPFRSVFICFRLLSSMQFADAGLPPRGGIGLGIGLKGICDRFPSNPLAAVRPGSGVNHAADLHYE
jgi:hypothetical protein